MVCIKLSGKSVHLQRKQCREQVALAWWLAGWKERGRRISRGQSDHQIWQRSLLRALARCALKQTHPSILLRQMLPQSCVAPIDLKSSKATLKYLRQSDQVAISAFPSLEETFLMCTQIPTTPLLEGGKLHLSLWMTKVTKMAKSMAEGTFGVGEGRGLFPSS